MWSILIALAFLPFEQLYIVSCWLSCLLGFLEWPFIKQVRKTAILNESFKNVALKLICDAVWILWVTDWSSWLPEVPILICAHWLWMDMGCWVVDGQSFCFLRPGPLESCGLVICRLVVWPLLCLFLLFAVVISECLSDFPIYSLIPEASVVLVVHLFVSLYSRLLTYVNITVQVVPCK